MVEKITKNHFRILSRRSNSRKNKINPSSDDDRLCKIRAIDHYEWFLSFCFDFCRLASRQLNDSGPKSKQIHEDEIHETLTILTEIGSSERLQSFSAKKFDIYFQRSILKMLEELFWRLFLPSYFEQIEKTFWSRKKYSKYIDIN